MVQIHYLLNMDSARIGNSVILEPLTVGSAIQEDVKSAHVIKL